MARSDTKSGVLEWFDLPVVDLFEWQKEVELFNQEAEKNSKNKK